jgi:hypothetical protein
VSARHLTLLLLAAVAVITALAFTGVPHLVAVKADEAACALGGDAECQRDTGPRQSRPRAPDPQRSRQAGDAAGGGSGTQTTPGDGGGDGKAGDTARQGTSPESRARAQLARLRVTGLQDPAGYDREKFPHWSDQGRGCTTRELVLKRDAKEADSDADCAVDGSWTSPYDGRTWTRSSDIDIDHMVPLKEAWRSGADEWTTEQRERFANDLRRPQLWSVTDNVNQEKSDQDPAEWRPPRHEAWCEYARAWIEVKSAWRLTVDTAEKRALDTMLERC